MNWKCRVLGHDNLTMTQGQSLIDLGCKRCGHKNMDVPMFASGSQTTWNSGVNNNRDLTDQLFYQGYSNKVESSDRRSGTLIL